MTADIVKFPRRHPGEPLPMSETDAAMTLGRLYERGDLLAAIEAGHLTTIDAVASALRRELDELQAHLERAGVAIVRCPCGILDSAPCVVCMGGTRTYFPDEEDDTAGTQ